jgi:hypothetical protein
MPTSTEERVVPRAATEAAKLVREAAAVLADDMTSVGFAISHWRDEGIHFEDILAETNRKAPHRLWNVQTTDGKVLWTETLTTVGFGVATVIVGARTAGHLTGEPSPALEVHNVVAGDPEQHGPAFYGLAHPNPSFLYRGVDELEILIEIPSDPGTTALNEGHRIGDALTLGEAVMKVSSVAAAHDLPLMLVQSPMAAPPAAEHPWPLPQSPGVRFGIAMPSGGVEDQLEIYREVHRWAEDMGCALHIGDRRGDGRRGLWHQLTVGDRSRYESRVSALPRSTEGLESVIPVTFVGPARVGTTAAIMKYLAAHRVPVLSVSVTPLENMAFINLLVGLAKGRGNPFSPAAYGSAAEILTLIGTLRLAGSATSDEEQRKVIAAAPQDYRACVGRVIDVAPLDRNKRVLWASWQFPEETGAPHMAISQLRTAAEQELGDGTVSVQYVVCRRGDAQDLRGRCKLSVSAEVDPAAEGERRSYARGELCRRIESRWRTLLGRGAPRSIIDVDVTWEESRLGRWLSPPGGARGEADKPSDRDDEQSPATFERANDISDESQEVGGLREMGEYMPAAVCRRGHVYARDLQLSPPADRCETCGGTILTSCSSCTSMIRGRYRVEGVVNFAEEYSPPEFCFNCGSPMPWATRLARIYELQNMLDEEDLDEAARLTVSEQLTALQNPDLDEDEQVERWKRIRRLAPGLMTSGQRIVESVATAAVKAQLGL